MNKDWKYDAKKKDVIDIIIDLFDDTARHLKKSKHIQNIQNFFKKFTQIKYKEKSGYIKLNSPNVFEEIKINEIKEIKFEKEIKIFNRTSKSKKTITEVTEPTIQQVMDALTVHIDYRKMIVDTLVNSIMLVVIIIVGFFEGLQYLIKRLIEGIKYLSTLPYKQMFNVLFRISMIIIAIGVSFYLYNYFKTTTIAQELFDKKINTLEKKVDDDFINVSALIEKERKRIDKLESTAVIVKHEFVEYNLYDKNGKLHQGKKIR